MVFTSRSPHLHKAHAFDTYDPISIIITAKDRERELPALFADIHNQVMPPIEIIFVDIGSRDKSIVLANRFGAKTISLNRSICDPRDYEAVARSIGARSARGNMLLFLDAGIRMAPDALLSIAQASRKNNSPISIQPFHLMRRGYENVSAFAYLFPTFYQGLAQSTKPKNKGIGLFPSIVLFTRRQWKKMLIDLASYYKNQNESSSELEILMGTKSVRLIEQDEYTISSKTLDYKKTEQYSFALRADVHGSIESSHVLIKQAPNKNNVIRIIRTTAASEPSSGSNLYEIPLDIYSYSIPSGAGKVSDVKKPRPEQYADIEDVLFGPEQIEKRRKIARKNASINGIQSKRSSTHWHRMLSLTGQRVRILRGSFLLRFRLVPDGFKSMFNDCVNEVAYQHPRPTSALVLGIFALFAMSISPALIIAGLIMHNNLMLGIGVLSYLVISFRLSSLLDKIGRYVSWVYLFFPLPLLFYYVVSFTAFLRKRSEQKY